MQYVSLVELVKGEFQHFIQECYPFLPSGKEKNLLRYQVSNFKNGKLSMLKQVQILEKYGVMFLLEIGEKEKCKKL